MQIYPSLISSDLLNIEKTLSIFDQACNGYHLDIMDDHFVPNLTWGPAFVNAIRKKTPLPLHIHLMVEKPEKWLDCLKLYENDVIIFHHESLNLLSEQRRFTKHIHEKKLKAGIAINPKTSVEDVFDLLSELDMILLMSVEPGFSGQPFIADVLKKIGPLQIIKKHHAQHIIIGIDGGIDTSNIKACAQLGIEQVAAASAIFSKTDPLAALNELYKQT